MAGKLLKREDCRTLVTEDADVYDKETGRCIAKFRKAVIPGKVQEAAFKALLPAAKTTHNRGTSGGKDETGRGSMFRPLKDGKVSKTIIAKNPVDSGIVGYFDRTARTPNCRLTAFNQQHLDKFKAAYPIIKVVDNFYKDLMPVEYAKQKKMADKTSQDFVIKATSFTTVTVNKNWQTAVHKDAGDYREGFGNLVALRKGQFHGGYFVVVRWGVGFDLQNGDLLLVDVHQWHGNTPIFYDDRNAVRLSLVMYYREKMIHCGTMKEELERAKRRTSGKLY